MVQFTTTYRYDYTLPVTDRYKFLEKTNVQEEVSNPSNCNKLTTNEIKSSNMPELSKKTNLKMEWTGIAPMGRIITPKLIPPDSDAYLARSQQKSTIKCIENQPNRFLKKLEKCYPDLYERLKRMTDNELKRRVNKQRLKTTYQIDYCRLLEFPDGIYHQRVVEETENEKKNVDVIEGSYEKFEKDIQTGLNVENKSFGFRKSDLEPKIRDDTNYRLADIETTNKPHITEYVDKICRTGCVVMQNKIHDHKNCSDGQKCVHNLKTLCKDFK
ncbi:uncharacterized protein LOC129610796 [Condylostylus longicornis]|uniref:uncharacterized protein LOC129610796 n=1 Tax=Condylostylus longicornis TaxID=2530218 RepID=UPI00244DF441|nr:uncharacterized protein LOC129610796 [Condylostylus longicornis]